MEELLVSIGEYVATEIESVKEVIYLDKKLGCMFYIDTNDGKRYLLLLIDDQMTKTPLKKHRLLVCFERRCFVFLVD